MRLRFLVFTVALMGCAVSQARGAAPVSPIGRSRDDAAAVRALDTAFSAAADAVSASVVKVTVASKRGRSLPGPDDDRLREFLGEDLYDQVQRRRRLLRDTGSGLIVDARGYIVTNHHVVEQAQDIVVQLPDEREVPAVLVGTDEKTDLAVLKIEGEGLVPATLGDSEHLRVGQWSIAIGTPFGLDRTVTVGIISATGRSHLGLTTYERFIQTDAAINPGNSGGPLIDLQGRVIGITTALVSGGQGIGFAIPISVVKDVTNQIIERGRVVRGWIGVFIQEVDAELAPWFGVAPRGGVLVAGVVNDGPAEVAGLVPGDVIVAFDDLRVRGVDDFQARATALAAGTNVALTIVRNGATHTLTVVVADMPLDDVEAASTQPHERWGLTVEALSVTDAWRADLPIGNGVLITGVARTGPAGRAGLERGDVVLEVKGHPVSDVSALMRELAAVSPGDTVPVYVYRTSSGRKEYVALERP
jgi:Do/DeqQ family serine protease